MTRKIVQISTNHQSGQDEELSVFALCDDGTLWYTISGRDFGNVPAKNPDEWYLAANVPQDPIDNDDYIWFSKKGY
jgi:hypothetical protein